MNWSLVAMSQILLPPLVSKDLFKIVLLQPVSEYDKLCVVSGFATAAMAKNHIDTIKNAFKKNINIDLIVGMTPETGIGTSHHSIFKTLTDDVNIPFNCSYVEMRYPPVHSKIYIWLRNNEPKLSFSGSANYTQNAFFAAQKEALSQCEPKSAYDYFEKLMPCTIKCNHIEAEEYCKQDDVIVKKGGYSVGAGAESLEVCELPLISTKTGEIQEAAGLNWGQSPALKNPKNPRNKDDAYLAVPKEIRRKNFFPPRGQYFSARTDDGYTITCVIAQADGKAIHTPNDNSEFGTYFRARLSVELGEKIETADLDRYGRRTVTFVKLDEEDYYMDFSL